MCVRIILHFYDNEMQNNMNKLYYLGWETE